jgi:hypothetical protein
MIAKELVIGVEIASDTQVHVITNEGVKLLDTSMLYEGNKFETSQQIYDYYNS